MGSSTTRPGEHLATRAAAISHAARSSMTTAPTGKRLMRCSTPFSHTLGRVEMWRSGCRPNISVAAPFVWRCLTGSTVAPFSTSRSSNRTCRFPASGSRARRHAFAHGSLRPRAVRCGPLLDVAADDIEHQIDAADVFQRVVVEVDELLRAEVERLLTVGSASGADD